MMTIKGHSLRRAFLQPATNTQNSKPRPPTSNARSKGKLENKIKHLFETQHRLATPLHTSRYSARFTIICRNTLGAEVEDSQYVQRAWYNTYMSQDGRDIGTHCTYPFWMNEWRHSPGPRHLDSPRIVPTLFMVEQWSLNELFINGGLSTTK